jgi:hypothetical protein
MHMKLNLFTVIPWGVNRLDVPNTTGIIIYTEWVSPAPPMQYGDNPLIVKPMSLGG